MVVELVVRLSESAGFLSAQYSSTVLVLGEETRRMECVPRELNQYIFENEI
ncbi:hypothetical protein MC885_012274 [Smutsia gigantea]|nr:hypothetical protein MC885_012274 [Smutsia gigantea]